MNQIQSVFLPTFLLLLITVSAATGNPDSLWLAWKNEQLHDTLRLQALQSFAKDGYLKSRPDSAYYYSTIQFNYAKEKGLKRFMAGARNTQGSSWFFRGDYNKALAYFQESDSLLQQSGDKKGRAALLNNMAAVNSRKGDLTNAIDLYNQSFELHRQLADTVGMIATLNGIGVQYKQQGQYDTAINYYQQSLELSRQTNNHSGTANALQNIGSLRKDQGDYVGALAALSEALKITEQDNNLSGRAMILNQLGIVQQEQRNLAAAESYYLKSVELRESMGDSKDLVNALVNLGVVYKLQADSLSKARNEAESLNYYDKAHQTLKRSIGISEQTGDLPAKAGALINIGTIFFELNEMDQALQTYTEALALSEQQGNQKALATVSNNIGLVYYRLGNIKLAETYARRGLELAQKIGSIKDVMHAAENLYKIYEQLKNPKMALEMHELYVQMTDRISSEENRREVIRQQYQFEFEQKQLLILAEQKKKDALNAENLRRKELERNAFIGGFAMMLLLTITFLTQRTRLAKEKKRSDELLLNILPAETAQELKDTGAAKAQHFDEVTVLFTDFKGFTEISEKVTPHQLVAMINECFSAFDKIMEKYGIEKIKTIGDAYMAVGGMPTLNRAKPEDVVQAALEVNYFIQEYAKRQSPSFDIRLGIHTGPVVAGIVGIKKFQYDIWGDTVNIASKVEQNGKIGQVHISESTYQLVKDKFNCSPVGEIEFKGKIRVYNIDNKAQLA